MSLKKLDDVEEVEEDEEWEEWEEEEDEYAEVPEEYAAMLREKDEEIAGLRTEVEGLTLQVMDLTPASPTSTVASPARASPARTPVSTRQSAFQMKEDLEKALQRGNDLERKVQDLERQLAAAKAPGTQGGPTLRVPSLSLTASPAVQPTRSPSWNNLSVQGAGEDTGKLTRRLSVLERVVSTQAEDAQQRVTENERLKKENEEMKKELAALKARTQMLAKPLDAPEPAAQEHDAEEMAKLQARLAALQKMFERTVQDKHKAEAEAERLRQLLGEKGQQQPKHADPAAEEDKPDYAELERRLAARQALLERTVSDKQRQDAAMSAMQEELAMLREQNGRLKSAAELLDKMDSAGKDGGDADDLARRLAALEALLQRTLEESRAKDETITRLEAAAKPETTATSQETQAAVNGLRHTVAQMDESVKEKDELARRLAALQKLLARTAQESAAKDAEIERLKADIAAGRAIVRQGSLLSGSSSTSLPEDEDGSSAEKIAALEKEILDLKARLEAALEANKNKDAKVVRQMKKLKQLESELAAAKADQAGSGSNAELVGQLQADLSAAEGALEDLSSMNEALEAEVARLKQLLAAQKKGAKGADSAATAKLQEQLKAATVAAAKLQKANQEKDKELAQAQKQLRRCQEAYTALQQQAQQFERTAEEVCKEANRDADRVAELQKQLANVQAQGGQARTAGQNQDSLIAALRHEIAELKKALAAAKHQAMNFERTAEEVCIEANRDAQRVQQLEREVGQLRQQGAAENPNQQREIHRLNAEVDALQNKCQRLENRVGAKQQDPNSAEVKQAAKNLAKTVAKRLNGRAENDEPILYDKFYDYEKELTRLQNEVLSLQTIIKMREGDVSQHLKEQFNRERQDLQGQIAALQMCLQEQKR